MSTATAGPITYGEHTLSPRGDYTGRHADWTCAQDWARYTAAEHERYRRLYAARSRHIGDEAAPEVLHALGQLDAAEAIPRFDQVSERLRRATGWELAPVPGLIPEDAFFALLAQRRFPITVWLREEDEFDYIVEPDVFHDFFGHVPLLFNRVFADYMQAFGAGGVKAQALARTDPALYGHALEMMARLYWYTVEFGLIQTEGGLRIYGAGILSSDAEPAHALYAIAPARVGFGLERVMTSRYRIDAFQDTYFVIDSFAQLFEATAPDFTPLYAQLAARTPTAPGIVLPGERLYRANLRLRA